jgi:hypothetical protein
MSNPAINPAWIPTKSGTHCTGCGATWRGSMPRCACSPGEDHTSASSSAKPRPESEPEIEPEWWQTFEGIQNRLAACAEAMARTRTKLAKGNISIGRAMAVIVDVERKTLQAMAEQVHKRDEILTAERQERLVEKLKDQDVSRESEVH